MNRTYEFVDEAQLSLRQKFEETKRDRPAFIFYLPAVIAASLKDLLDLVIGWIPGIGFVLAIMFGTIIFILLYFIKTNKSLLSSGLIIKRVLIMIFAVLAESIPLFNFIPITTATVLLIWFLDTHASEKQLEILSRALKKV